jgi:virginiamycin B lyase
VSTTRLRVVLGVVGALCAAALLPALAQGAPGGDATVEATAFTIGPRAAPRGGRLAGMRWLIGALLMVALASPTSAAAFTITEFEAQAGAPEGAHAPRYIQPGPDGALWYTDSGTRPGIGRITTAGVRLAAIPDPQIPVDLVVAPDGTVYWTADEGITRRAPNGTLISRTTFGAGYGIGLTAGGLLRIGRTSQVTALVCGVTPGPAFDPRVEDCETPFVRPGRITDLTLGGDGRLWGAWYEANQIRRLGETGFSSELLLDLPAGSGPARIALGPDGNLWVTMYDAGTVDRVTPTAERTRFTLPDGSRPNDIAAGPDGALWITDLGRGRILRMRTDGVVTDDLSLPNPGSDPIGIVAGPDGAMWYTEPHNGHIGRIALPPAAGRPGAPLAGAPAPADLVAPRFLSSPVFAPPRLRPRGSGTLSFALSEPGAVRVRIERASAGRRTRRGCVRPARGNRSRPLCTRYVAVRTLASAGRQGANVVSVSGRGLAPGGHRALVTVTDAAGNVSRRARATFTVVRR